MTYEEAFFYRLTIIAGIKDAYEQWLEEHLEIEEALNDITLELYLCGSDKNIIANCLYSYYVDKEVNTDLVFELVWNYLKKLYIQNEISQAICIEYMTAIGLAYENWHEEPWISLVYMGDFYDEAQAGIITKDSFDRIFNDFIFSKIPVTTNDVKFVPSETIWHKIKKFFQIK